MNRRKFLKAMLVVPLAPAILYAAVKKPELSFIEKFRLARKNIKFKPPLSGVSSYVPPIDVDDGTLLIDYWKVVIEKGKTYFEICYKHKVGNKGWVVLKKMFNRDDIKGFIVWHGSCADHVEYVIDLKCNPGKRYFYVYLN